jgi:hypothetical protein
MKLNYLSISFRNLLYAGKCSRFHVGAVRVSKLNLALTGSATTGTSDAIHANASSPTFSSLSTYKPSAENVEFLKNYNLKIYIKKIKKNKKTLTF